MRFELNEKMDFEIIRKTLCRNVKMLHNAALLTGHVHTRNTRFPHFVVVYSF